MFSIFSIFTYLVVIIFNGLKTSNSLYQSKDSSDFDKRSMLVKL